MNQLEQTIIKAVRGELLQLPDLISERYLGMSFLHSALNGALIKAGGSAVVLDKGVSVVGAKPTWSRN